MPVSTFSQSAFRWAVGVAGLALTLGACGDDGENQPESVTLTGDTPCERFASLAAAKGCAVPTECAIPQACSSMANQWLDCAARDLSQCLCETDGSLNCEGSYKPDEGPARCTSAYTALDQCLEE